MKVQKLAHEWLYAMVSCTVKVGKRDQVARSLEDPGTFHSPCHWMDLCLMIPNPSWLCYPRSQI